MAYARMRRERAGHTLQPSALVHETLIRLFDSDALVKATDRHHLFAAAATAMRRVLVEHARRRGEPSAAADGSGSPWTKPSLTSMKSVWTSSSCTRPSTD